MAKTIQLINLSGMQLSVNLCRWKPTASARVRATKYATTPVCINRGEAYDICARLDVDFAEAQLIAKSPEVRRFERCRPPKIQVREFPPSPATVFAEAQEQARHELGKAIAAAANPPEAPNAVPVGVDLERAGLPEDTPRLRSWPGPTQPIPREEEVSPVAAPDGPPQPAVPPIDADEAQPMVDETVDEAVPSMDWTLKQLKAYAEEQGIVVARSASKTSVLRTIQKARMEAE